MGSWQTWGALQEAECILGRPREALSLQRWLCGTSPER